MTRKISETLPVTVVLAGLLVCWIGATAIIRPASATDPSFNYNAKDGATASTLGNQMMGKYGTTAKSIKADSAGNVYVRQSGYYLSPRAAFTTDTQVYSGPVYLWGFSVYSTNLSSTASINIENSYVASATAKGYKMEVKTVPHTVMFPHPLLMNKGIYADVSASGATTALPTVSIIYSTGY